MYKYFFVLLLPFAAQAQKAFNLATLLKQNRLTVVNREAVAAQDGIHLSAHEGEGIAWLNGETFSEGVIELDIRGQDVEQQSFVGVAFHGVDSQMLDAVYFRPFNFKSSDSAKHTHMVQYISHPQYTWQLLRAQFSGQYEKPVMPVPDPNNWFHVRIEVTSGAIKVYVNRNAVPSLAVRPLAARTDGKIGLWVSLNSPGDFAHLTITKTK
jgi:hypothetical protein